ncbi:hypothetical protein OG453_43255 [Streptomyces sp. NBC_01381]|uniref:hypothetical protein n=1 Tax=Streptomyces sp. NBC_01381 TaxID=2903845 RepID=UPI002258D41A|nr:hypothetical protein [Streptomyces sp. NBC_01381]MCX4673382.1 hypothetical protein [Streptomyces sp. NBC_01381]
MAVVFYGAATVAEVIVYVVPRAENGAVRVLDATLGRVPFVPLWCVSPLALVREGDTAYYRARVDRRIEILPGRGRGLCPERRVGATCGSPRSGLFSRPLRPLRQHTDEMLPDLIGK